MRATMSCGRLGSLALGCLLLASYCGRGEWGRPQTPGTIEPPPRACNERGLPVSQRAFCALQPRRGSFTPALSGGGSRTPSSSRRAREGACLVRRFPERKVPAWEGGARLACPRKALAGQGARIPPGAEKRGAFRALRLHG